MELYIGLVLISIFMILFIYIKLRYPFWNMQPVFHSYDFWRYFINIPFIIQNGIPIKTKYVDTKVNTRTFLDISEKDVSKLTDLLQCYYISSDKMLTLTNASDIRIELTGQSHPSFVSFYEDYSYQKSENQYGEMDVLHTKQNPRDSMNTIITTINQIGCMTSRAIRLFIIDKNKEMHPFYAYYWDHICLHRDFQEKHLTRNIIQSHERYQRIYNPDVSISLFKKEIHLCEGIVPVVKYSFYTFELNKIKSPPLDKQFYITRIVQENSDLLSDLLYGIVHKETNNDQFGFCAFPEINVLDNLIKNNLMYIYVLRKHKHPYAYFFFRNTRTSYDTVEEGNVLECIGSIMNMQGNVQETQSTFFAAFLAALFDIQENIQTTFKFLVLNEISHNHILLERWKWKYPPIFVNDAAYYLYNAVCPRMTEPKRCLILI
tara:strand:- start:159 stop:1454 length:1296 start_codon:yes stop_codon:yes gene_type:complete